MRKRVDLLIKEVADRYAQENFLKIQEYLRDLIRDINTNGLSVGTVLLSALPEIPDGFLEANGQAVNRTQYATLYAKIGNTFGAGNGTTTFNVPNPTPVATLTYIIKF